MLRPEENSPPVLHDYNAKPAIAEIAHRVPKIRKHEFALQENSGQYSQCKAQYENPPRIPRIG
jgi:hypothetical protein